MTYLELVNEVLIRLREDTIEASTLDSDPYYRVIGSHVNDAKDRVEDAWQWGSLRTTDFFTEDSDVDPSDNLYQRVQPGQVNVALPNSADNHYQLKRLFVRDTGGFLRYYSVPQMRDRYAGVYLNGPPTGTIFAYSFADDDEATGNKQITLYPIPDREFNVEIDVVRHQDRLVNADDRLKVPSLPVYTLATALASRERGEVGGTPTSELFAIADRHLSDAIAIDSARFVEEMDWFAEDIRWHQTNIRTR